MRQADVPGIRVAQTSFAASPPVRLAAHPTLLEEFEEERKQQAAMMRKMKLDPAKFRTETERVEAIAEYFRFHKQFKILGFWDWDQQVNPNGYGTKGQSSKAH